MRAPDIKAACFRSQMQGAKARLDHMVKMAIAPEPLPWPCFFKPEMQHGLAIGVCRADKFRIAHGANLVIAHCRANRLFHDGRQSRFFRF